MLWIYSMVSVDRSHLVNTAVLSVFKYKGRFKETDQESEIISIGLWG